MVSWNFEAGVAKSPVHIINIKRRRNYEVVVLKDFLRIACGLDCHDLVFLSGCYPGGHVATSQHVLRVAKQIGTTVCQPISGIDGVCPEYLILSKRSSIGCDI